MIVGRFLALPIAFRRRRLEKKGAGETGKAFRGSDVRSYPPPVFIVSVGQRNRICEAGQPE